MKESHKSIALAVIPGASAIALNLTMGNGLPELAAWCGLVALTVAGVARYDNTERHQYSCSGDLLNLVGEFAQVKRRFAGWEFCSAYRKRVVAALEESYFCEPGAMIVACVPGQEYDQLEFCYRTSGDDYSAFDDVGVDFCDFVSRKGNEVSLKSYKSHK